MNLIQFARDDDASVKNREIWNWFCYCGAELSIQWRTDGHLYNTDYRMTKLARYSINGVAKVSEGLRSS